jgi:hypothetical protein
MKPEDKTAEDILKEAQLEIAKKHDYPSFDHIIWFAQYGFTEARSLVTEIINEASLLAMSKVAEQSVIEGLDIAKSCSYRTEEYNYDGEAKSVSTYMNNLFKKI